MSLFASTEASYLLHKHTSNERKPVEVLLAAVVAVLAYAVCYLALCFELRYRSHIAAMIIGPGLICLVACALCSMAYTRHKRGRPKRLFVLVLSAVAAGAGAGTFLGNRNWWKYTVYNYNYKDMASYVNVDPGVDVGQSFMDAGTVYFKEGSYVLTRKAIAFKNGLTYCVAPIVRQPVQMVGQNNPNSLDTATGFAAPRSGSIDFWAVGTDCCGKTGTDAPFTCGDVQSQLSRSGMRVLDTSKRALYLLAVQEWAASTGLPTRHPLFFEWVRDPIMDSQAYLEKAQLDFWLNMCLVFMATGLIAFLLQVLFHKFGMR